MFLSGAVKFGDPLYLEECEILLKNLSECQVPFQCAHGRPSLVPIVDLQRVNRQQDEVRSLHLWASEKVYFHIYMYLSVQERNPWPV